MGLFFVVKCDFARPPSPPEQKAFCVDRIIFLSKFMLKYRPISRPTVYYFSNSRFTDRAESDFENLDSESEDDPLLLEPKLCSTSTGTDTEIEILESILIFLFK